jgi:hypothetical protein
MRPPAGWALAAFLGLTAGVARAETPAPAPAPAPAVLAAFRTEAPAPAVDLALRALPEDGPPRFHAVRPFVELLSYQSFLIASGWLYGNSPLKWDRPTRAKWRDRVTRAVRVAVGQASPSSRSRLSRVG